MNKLVNVDRSLLVFVDRINGLCSWDKLICWPLTLQYNSCNNNSPVYAVGGLGRVDGISPYDGTVSSTMVWTTSGTLSNTVSGTGYIFILNGAALLSADQITSGAVYAYSSNAGAGSESYILYGNQQNSTVNIERGGRFEQDLNAGLVNKMKGASDENIDANITSWFLATQEDSSTPFLMTLGTDDYIYVNEPPSLYIYSQGGNDIWLVDQDSRIPIIAQGAQYSTTGNFRISAVQFFANTINTDLANNSNSFINGNLRTTRTISIQPNVNGGPVPSNLSPYTDSYVIGKVENPIARTDIVTESGSIAFHFIMKDTILNNNQVSALYVAYKETIGSNFLLP